MLSPKTSGKNSLFYKNISILDKFSNLVSCFCYFENQRSLSKPQVLSGDKTIQKNVDSCGKNCNSKQWIIKNKALVEKYLPSEDKTVKFQKSIAINLEINKNE